MPGFVQTSPRHALAMVFGAALLLLAPFAFADQTGKAGMPACGTPAAGAEQGCIGSSGSRPVDGRRSGIRLPDGSRLLADLAYGNDPAQRFDVYLPEKVSNAPVIVMMHGGGWALGSKSSRGVVQNKIDHYLPKGFIFVSVETRLLPQANPLQQADDLAQAMAKIQQDLPSWGGDGDRLVLMGHSAGAHLVALVSADPSIAESAGVRPWLSTIAIDSAAYDVPVLMGAAHVPELYRYAFGTDPVFWEKASPVAHAKAGSRTQLSTKILLVCSPLRQHSCPQAKSLADQWPGRAEVLKVALRHMPINAELGREGEYTDSVDAYLESLGVK